MKIRKMNPAAKAAWVEALRSGKYKKGKQLLFDGKCMCVMGVLAAVHAEATGAPPLTASLRDRLTDAAARWAGVPSISDGLKVNEPVLPLAVVPGFKLRTDLPDDLKVCLHVLNDGSVVPVPGYRGYADVKAMSFRQMADLIEEHL